MAVVSPAPAVMAESAVINPHVVAGSAAIVIALLSLLVYLYRRRLFILWWVGAWTLLAASMVSVARVTGNAKLDALVYGLSQFTGVLSSLAFVVAADAYRQQPRLRRGYGLVLLAMAIFMVFLPVSLIEHARIVFAVGHLLIAGGMAAAAAAHLLLLRYARLLGATIVGGALLAIAGVNAWIGAAIGAPDGSTSMTPALVGMSVVFLVAALGQQLMAFEDMTYELRQTNRRLETAQNELRQLVITDALTGTRNRRFFDEVIGRELQRHRRYRTPLSIVFIDVDRFKAINDTLGHETGDRVLRDVAVFLLRNIREADYVFRWGGDEFLVLISCTEQEALRRAADLQEAFSRSPHLTNLPSGVGLSIGCVEVPPDTDDILPLIQSADERMYADKKHHRAARQRAH
jgi:diguanylate cyclase (GGDEF)-like protein